MIAVGTYTIQVQRANGATYLVGEIQDVSQCFIESKDLDLGDPYTYKLLRAAELMMSTPGKFHNLHFIVKYRNNYREPFRTLDVSAEEVDEALKLRMRNCKYLRLRIEDQGIAARWHLTEIKLYGTVAGKRL